MLAHLNAAQGAGDDLTAALIDAKAADYLVNSPSRASHVPPSCWAPWKDEAIEDAAALPEPFAARLPRLLGSSTPTTPLPGSVTLWNAASHWSTPAATPP
ncbi:hypothetical protein [Streptomyces sp. NPDC017964]|uniref:hypothetical protein n=1 Tax=Streptomyces sp. NPDC017964 TaxID=3365022 RepID=UPI00379CB583